MRLIFIKEKTYDMRSLHSEIGESGCFASLECFSKCNTGEQKFTRFRNLHEDTCTITLNQVFGIGKQNMRKVYLIENVLWWESCAWFRRLFTITPQKLIIDLRDVIFIVMILVYS